MGSAAFTSPTSGTETIEIPTYVKKAWCAAIGGGGQGEDYGFACSDAAIYGGGGGAAASGFVQGGTIRYRVGNGGGRGDGYNGGNSFVKDEENQGILAGGGRGGGFCSNPGKGGTSSGGGGDGQDGEGFQAFIFISGRGGGAGKVNGGNAGRGPSGIDLGCLFGDFDPDPEIPDDEYQITVGGSGGDGAGIPTGNGDPGASNSCSIRGGDGGDYGGGGGAVAAFSDSKDGGKGGRGAAYIEWITIEGITKTIVRSGETFQVTVSSPKLGTSTQNVVFTNEGEVPVEEKYRVEDSRGNVSEVVVTVLPKVRIKTLIASPNPQNSGGDGIPNYNTFLIWEGISVLSAVATRDDGAVSATWEEKAQPTDPDSLPNFYTAGSKSVTNLFQSVSIGSSQPGSDTTYTLTATDGFNTTTATVKVKAYNDNCPDNFTIADQLGKEPLEVINISTSPITGIDMDTTVVCSSGLTILGSGGVGYTTSTLITPGSTLNLRVQAEPFNTDERGLVNEKTVSVTVGCLTVSFIVQTRAPIVEEIFDFGDNQFGYPFPKLDTRVVGEPLDDGGTYQEPQPYLQSPTIVEPTADAWEVELESPFGVQIKAKDIRSSPSNTTQYTDISSQNDTKLEVNVRRQGNQPNNTWTKPNIS
jgi:hypothetical protein